MNRLIPKPQVSVREPLWRQFSQLRPRRKTRHKDLCYETRSSQSTIGRALAQEQLPDRHTNPVLAMHIGQLLGLAPEYVALAFMRDECRYYPLDMISANDRSDQPGSRPLRELVAARGAIADQLDAVLASMNPFANSGKVKRLAFRMLRLQLGLGRVAAAHRISQVEHDTPAKLAKILRAYEGGLALVADPQIYKWCDALMPGGAARFLELGERLLQAHSFSDTVELTQTWPPPGSRDNGPFYGKQEGLRWYTAPGGSISLSRSPTIFGSVSLEVLTATQPRVGERSTMRCLNARHSGCEIGVVVNGAIRLTISEQPFPEEGPCDLPRFVEGQAGVLLDRVYHEGEAVYFSSNLFHRCEFLEMLTRVVSLNLSGSVLLGRRGGKIKAQS
jgi:hypothetical protein